MTYDVIPPLPDKLIPAINFNSDSKNFITNLFFTLVIGYEITLIIRSLHN